jgi:integrative and conjugative element protein (TIGR02256 family)
MHVQSAFVTWLPAALHERCTEEAERRFPLETGGVFMGYWADSRCAVVTHAIGPGPEAVHERRNFEPDHDWQLRAIAGHYRRSGRRETYLGDWHSHPGAVTGSLSRADRRVLRRIINTPAARAATPIMAIFHGGEMGWTLALWRAEMRPRSFLWPKLVLDEVEVRIW